MRASDALAAALLPIVTRDPGVLSGWGKLRIWARGRNGSYAHLIAEAAGRGVEVRTYQTKAAYDVDTLDAGTVRVERRYQRGLVVVGEDLAMAVRRTYASPRLLRRAVRRNWDVVVRAFMYYSPRGLSGEQVYDRLVQLVGRRKALALVRQLLARLGRTRRWLRPFYKHKPSWGLMMRVMKCVNLGAKLDEGYRSYREMQPDEFKEAFRYCMRWNRYLAKIGMWVWWRDRGMAHPPR